MATWSPAGKRACREEQVAILELADEVKARLDAEFEPDGYNGGFNAGAAAGQTVPHRHPGEIAFVLGRSGAGEPGGTWAVGAGARRRGPGSSPR